MTVPFLLIVTVSLFVEVERSPLLMFDCISHVKFVFAGVLVELLVLFVVLVVLFDTDEVVLDEVEFAVELVVVLVFVVVLVDVLLVVFAMTVPF